MLASNNNAEISAIFSSKIKLPTLFAPSLNCLDEFFVNSNERSSSVSILFSNASYFGFF